MAGSSVSRSAIRAAGVFLITAAVLACGGAASSAPQATGTAAAGLCGLFTPADLAPFLGAEPAPGRVGGPLDSSCEWDAGEPFLMIQKVPTDYFEDLRGAAGYRNLDGIGDYAFVAAHAFGRIASARTVDAAYIVIASEGTDVDDQIEILRSFVERAPGPPDLAGPGSAAETDPP
jgi:hypothetical protein